MRPAISAAISLDFMVIWLVDVVIFDIVGNERILHVSFFHKKQGQNVPFSLCALMKDKNGYE